MNSKVKLIALDLDGTTLKNDGQLTERNKKALESAVDAGVRIVIATGRVFSALPKEIHAFDGISYAITSNGANVVDLTTGKTVYSSFLKASAVDALVEILKQHDFAVEAFISGQAYIEKAVYDNIRENGSTYRNAEYILTTREPVSNLFDKILMHKDSIENININFEGQNQRIQMWQDLVKRKDLAVTSSLEHNLEVGGKEASKAAALKQLCTLLNIPMREVMACGDSHNDIEMLRAAGLAIAMGNANSEVKAAARHIVSSNEEDGVAEAIERFVL